MKIIERIVNAETGESVDIERELTAQEIAEREETALKFAAQQEEANRKAIARAAILEKLGLTEDEAAVLLA